MALKIETYTSPNTSSRDSWQPDLIVCHICEGYYTGSISWLCNPASGASSHYVVGKDGRVAQLVPLTRMAWVNGTSSTPSSNTYYGKSLVPVVRNRKVNANKYSIGIEFEGFYKDAKGALTEAQFNAAVELLKHIQSEVKRIYGYTIPLDKDHIWGHCHITPKHKPNCPGQAFPFDRLIAEVNKNQQNVNIEEDDDMAIRYQTLNDVPEWARADIKRLIDASILSGEGKDAQGNLIINISHDMMRMLLMNMRAGAYDSKLK